MSVRLPEVPEEGDTARLAAAFSIIDGAGDMEAAILQLRDLLGLEHLVYHSSKLGSSPSLDPYIRLTYPAAWIKRYLQRGYVDLDPVLGEGFRRTLPFQWGELTIASAAELAFMHDALAHGIGPHGLSIPVRSKQGHRGLFSISSSQSEVAWVDYLARNMSVLIEVANHLHRRVIKDVFGEDKPHLTEREIECLRWTSLGKHSGDIATILQISPHTARDYLKSARFKLDCVTSAQAVSKAISLGLLATPGA